MALSVVCHWYEWLLIIPGTGMKGFQCSMALIWMALSVPCQWCGCLRKFPGAGMNGLMVSCIGMNGSQCSLTLV